MLTDTTLNFKNFRRPIIDAIYGVFILVRTETLLYNAIVLVNVCHFHIFSGPYRWPYIVIASSPKAGGLWVTQVSSHTEDFENPICMFLPPLMCSAMRGPGYEEILPIRCILSYLRRMDNADQATRGSIFKFPANFLFGILLLPTRKIISAEIWIEVYFVKNRLTYVMILENRKLSHEKMFLQRSTGILSPIIVA